MSRTYHPPTSVEELMKRYHEGERHFEGTQIERPVFGSVQLSGVDLSRSSLPSTVFGEADLDDINLTESDLSSFGCWDISVTNCNLSRSKLFGADIEASVFRRVNFDNCDFSHVSFKNVGFFECSFAGAKLSDCVFVNTDITALCDSIPPARHGFPSHVDYSTVTQSLRSVNLKDFLLRSGMPAVFVEYMVDCARSLDEGGLFSLMQTTFISYGDPDTAFAQTLREALHANGVTTFFFPEDAMPGKKLHRQMREGVNNHDRVILICSRASLDRPGVLNEIQETLSREARDGGVEYLIPIRLDDYVLKGWKPTDPGTAQAIRDRVVADFEGTASDPVKFNRALLRLLAALKK